MQQATILAIIAGFADTIGYLRYQAFAGLMTGNTIFLGIDLTSGHYGRAAFHFGIIAVFLLGVIASRLLIRSGVPVWSALTVAAALLVLCNFTSHAMAAFVLALAMGMQNSAANRFNGVALNTVFITGNLQKIGEGFVHWLWPSKDRPAKSDGMAIFALVWAGYAGGAALGALGDFYLTYPLLIPAALLPIVMIEGIPSAKT